MEPVTVIYDSYWLLFYMKYFGLKTRIKLSII